MMAHIKERAGHVRVRVGGNTQETAVLVDSLADGKMIEKGVDVSNPVRLRISLTYVVAQF